jgi:hypothetical protein
MAKKMSRKGIKKPVPEAQALKPMKGQESPETKVSKPMQTRAQAQAASGAGCLRPGGGSWQKRTFGAKGTPPKT